LLKRSGLAFDINLSGKRLTKEELPLALKDFDGVVAGIETYDASVLSALPQLKCISRCGVGVDNVDLKLAAERNIAVLNTPQVVNPAGAEIALAMILGLLRRLNHHTKFMRQRKWEKITGGLLAGRKVGVVGLGRIGRRVAELLSKLDADVY